MLYCVNKKIFAYSFIFYPACFTRFTYNLCIFIGFHHLNEHFGESIKEKDSIGMFAFQQNPLPDYYKISNVISALQPVSGPIHRHGGFWR